jgi:hypothetical protein
MTQNRVPNPRAARYVSAVRDERQASNLVALVTLALLGASLLVLAAVLQ